MLSFFPKAAENECPLIQPLLQPDAFTKTSTTWKVSVFIASFAHVFPHSDWIRRDTPYFSIFSPNAGKYRPGKLQIQTLFTQGRFWNWKRGCKKSRRFIKHQETKAHQQLYKYTTCILHWKDVETTVSTSFQRGINVVCL